MILKLGTLYRQRVQRLRLFEALLLSCPCGCVQDKTGMELFAHQLECREFLWAMEYVSTLPTQVVVEVQA